jgi:hypothetical protein
LENSQPVDFADPSTPKLHNGALRINQNLVGGNKVAPSGGNQNIVPTLRTSAITGTNF